jgi:hypothetical protein
MKGSTILSLAGVALITLVVGTALGSVAFPMTRTETSTLLSSFTSTRTDTQTLISSVSGNVSTTTLTIEKEVQGITITEIVVIQTGTIGGSMYCSGNLTANECTGSSIEQILSSSSTSYIFPANSTGIYFNATITQATSYESLTCPATTSTSTISYNSTSGLGQEYISWSRSCP